MVFYFRLIPGKISDKGFSKHVKNTALGPKNIFGQKMLFLSVFFLILTKFHCAKLRKSQCAVSKQHWFQTDVKTSKHEFVKPFLLKPVVQQVF